MEQLDLRIFDLSPIPMWIQDYSGVKKIFEQWTAQGIVDLRAYLLEQPNRMLPCLASIKTLKINQSTLKLYEANDLEEILENFAKFHFEEITVPQIIFFTGLWQKIPDCVFAPTNYTCTGKKIDVQLKANIIPGYEESWEKILLTTEDITTYQNARRFAEAIFMHSPTSLWVKDYSEIKKSFDQLKQNKLCDLNLYIQSNPAFVQRCFNNVRSKQVNAALLSLFKANCIEDFNRNVAKIYHQDALNQFKKELLYLANIYENPVDFTYETESEYQTLDGSSIYVHTKLNIFPDSLNSWGTIQIAYTDFTERKHLENHLNFLSKHDQLTQLHNRTFFNEEVERLSHSNVSPLSCIYLDINGLKHINDSQGHHYGDLLLQRFAFILKKVTHNQCYTVSRLGGDEFVILMPYADEQTAIQLLNQIENQINQEAHSHFKISISSGIASSNQYIHIEQLIRAADENMYSKKRIYYNTSAN